MIDTTPQREPSLPEFLTHRARRASDGRLVLDAGGGLVTVAAFALLRPPGWFILAAAGLCFLAFGSWAIADRELSERRASIGGFAVAALVGARVIAAVVGALAAVFLIFAAVALTLGAWIS